MPLNYRAGKLVLFIVRLPSSAERLGRLACEVKEILGVLFLPIIRLRIFEKLFL